MLLAIAAALAICAGVLLIFAALNARIGDGPILFGAGSSAIIGGVLMIFFVNVGTAVMGIARSNDCLVEMNEALLSTNEKLAAVSAELLKSNQELAAAATELIRSSNLIAGTGRELVRLNTRCLLELENM